MLNEILAQTSFGIMIYHVEICRLKILFLDDFCCNEAKMRERNMFFEVDNCLLWLNNVEKVN